MPRLDDIYVRTFNRGLVTRLREDHVPRGAATSAENWMTKGDHIELRRGYKLLGTESSGTGKITGLHVGTRFDGTKVILFTHDRKIKYYDEDNNQHVELGTDTLPSDADGEDVAIDSYHSLAGAFFYISSPNSSIYKVPIANPGSIVDLNSNTHRGYMTIKQGRMFLWNRTDTDGGSDATGLYGSHIDKDELSDYPETTGESVGTGDGSTKNFTGTLSNVSGVKTCMYVRIDDTNETFTDDRNGNLNGDKGGTGTINYATGAFNITFNSAPANAQDITADYYTEDATSAGVADFTKSTPRTAGEGFTFRQDDGGAEFQNIASIGDSEYCFHTYKTWELTLTDDDTNATNLIYRNKVGIPYWRALQEKGDGIIYLDNTDETGAFVRKLRISDFSTEVIPVSLSQEIDLEDYRFNAAMMFEWGDYEILVCRHKDSELNDTMFFRNRVWSSEQESVWDRLTIRASVLGEKDGALVAGDSGSNNIFQLFDGWSDEEANIFNHWDTGEDYLDKGSGTEVFGRFLIEGIISKDQELEILASYDNSDFVSIGTISGGGSYVDSGQAVTIGSTLIGSNEIGGGSGGTTAYPYRREIRVASTQFEKVKLRFKANKIGYVSVSEYAFKDRRLKSQRTRMKYI